MPEPETRSTTPQWFLPRSGQRRPPRRRRLPPPPANITAQVCWYGQLQRLNASGCISSTGQNPTLLASSARTGDTAVVADTSLRIRPSNQSRPDLGGICTNKTPADDKQRCCPWSHSALLRVFKAPVWHINRSGDRSGRLLPKIAYAAARSFSAGSCFQC